MSRFKIHGIDDLNAIGSELIFAILSYRSSRTASLFNYYHLKSKNYQASASLHA